MNEKDQNAIERLHEIMGQMEAERVQRLQTFAAFEAGRTALNERWHELRRRSEETGQVLAVSRETPLALSGDAIPVAIAHRAALSSQISEAARIASEAAIRQSRLLDEGMLFSRSQRAIEIHVHIHQGGDDES